MPDDLPRRSDGGESQRRDDGDGNQTPGIDADLPEDSLFTLDDYLEMYHVASTKPAFGILRALSEEDRLSESELAERLGRDGNSLHYYLRKLKRSALVRNRRDPNTGTDEPYSYYTLSELGETVLEYGLQDGIKKLAREEAEISDEYSN